MQILNLTQTDVFEVTKLLKELQKDNNDISYKIFSSASPSPRINLAGNNDERIEAIEEKVDSVISLIKRTIGNHILVNGRWITTDDKAIS